MRRLIPCLALALLAIAAATAMAVTPNPNGALITPRVFNDCTTSTFTSVYNYPAEITLHDADLDCASGFANLHNWRFSEDGGVTQAVFNNDSHYHFSVDMVLTGSGNGEGGLSVSPWWSRDVDGRLNVRVPDGEIACFGGRLPFFSFTATYGLHYVKGEPIHLEITYEPHSLTMADPATIKYLVHYQGMTYTSPQLPFDQGNPAEDPPYGLWGMLNNGRVGGFMQCLIQAGDPPTDFQASFTNIRYWNLDLPTAVEPSTWGNIKAIYR